MVVCNTHGQESRRFPEHGNAVGGANAKLRSMGVGGVPPSGSKQQNWISPKADGAQNEQQPDVLDRSKVFLPRETPDASNRHMNGRQKSKQRRSP